MQKTAKLKIYACTRKASLAPVVWQLKMCVEFRGPMKRLFQYLYCGGIFISAKVQENVKS